MPYNNNESYTEGIPWLEEFPEEQVEKVSPLYVGATGLVAYFTSIFIAQLIISDWQYSQQVAMLVSEALLGLIPLYLVYQRYKKSIKMKEFMRLSLSKKAGVIGVIFGIALFFLGIYLTYLLFELLGPSPIVEEVNESMTQLILSSPTSAILIAIALGSAGVWEEILFRGLFLRALEEKYNFRVAQVVSAAFFGLAHFDPTGVYTIITFIYGIIIAEVYRKWKTLIAPIFTHVTLNLMGFIIILLFG